MRCPELYALGRGTERDTRITPHAVLAPRSTARPRPPRRPDAGACVRARRARRGPCRYIVQSSSPIVLFAYSWCVYTCNRSLPQPVHLAGTYAHTKRHNSHVHHRDPYVRTIRDPHDIARRTHREWPWGACAHTCSRAHTCVHALGRPPRPTQPRTECSSSLAQRGKERGALQRDAETSLGKQADIAHWGPGARVECRNTLCAPGVTCGNTTGCRFRADELLV